MGLAVVSEERRCRDVTASKSNCVRPLVFLLPTLFLLVLQLTDLCRMGHRPRHSRACVFCAGRRVAGRETSLGRGVCVCVLDNPHHDLAPSCFFPAGGTSRRARRGCFFLLRVAGRFCAAAIRYSVLCLLCVRTSYVVCFVGPDPFCPPLPTPHHPSRNSSRQSVTPCVTLSARVHCCATPPSRCAAATTVAAACSS